MPDSTSSLTRSAETSQEPSIRGPLHPRASLCFFRLRGVFRAPDTDIDASVGGLMLVTVGGTYRVRIILPGSPSNHTLLSAGGTGWVLRRAVLIIVLVVIVLDPLPDVARHLIGPVRTPSVIILVLFSQCRGSIPKRDVLDAKVTSISGDRIIAPWIGPAINASRRFFPLSFSRQAAARPLTECAGIIPAHVDHRQFTHPIQHRSCPPNTEFGILVLRGSVACVLAEGEVVRVGAVLFRTNEVIQEPAVLW